MKKFILAIVSIVLLFGIGYTGYVIFSSKSISKIEIDGNIQTIYLATDNISENDLPNFQDAKLKITYKSGDVKYLELKNTKNIEVKDFSTSIEASRTMKITYKSQMIKVDYNVVKSGLYYLNSKETVKIKNEEPVVIDNKSYKITNTQEFYYLDEKEGTLKYYSYDIHLSRWVLYDGKYLKNYKYEVIDDKIKIYLGSDEPVYMMQASAVNGAMVVSATNYTYTGDLQTGKVVNYFSHYEMKTNVSVSNAELYSKDFKAINDYKYIEFKVGDTLKSSDNTIYLDVNYSSALIYVSDKNGSNITEILKNIYVVLDDSMIKNGGRLQTDYEIDYTFSEISYETFVNTLYYKVVA